MIAHSERRTPDGWLILPVVSFKQRSGLRGCGGCARLFHSLELYAGRGKHLGEHPDHQFAPCGCDVSYSGSSPVAVAAPAARNEVMDRAGLCRSCETPLTRSERPFRLCLCCSPASVNELPEGFLVAA